MFVPRSSRRIRVARTLFVLAALLPFVALVAWAVRRHSVAHREAVRESWEEAVGLPLVVDSVEHPLPGVVRARGCSLAGPDGRTVLAVGTVRVETSPAEVRIAIDAIECDPAGAAVLAGLAADWLERGPRFRRDVVVEVAGFAWSVPGDGGRPARTPLGPVRLECVAKDGDRAVRVVRREGDDARDEVRIVRSGGDAAAGCRVDVEASCVEPLPFPILAAVAGRGVVAALPVGGSAVVRGRLSAVRADGGWSGSVSGRVERVDLAACTAPLAARATGPMDLRVDGVEWRDGRITAAEFTCEASSGRVDRRLLEALVSTMGCRAGAASVDSATDGDRAFDAAGWRVRIDGRGIAIAGSPRLGGAVAVVAGRPLLEPPAGIVPPERLAWLLAPSRAVYVPSSGPGTWVLSILPSAEGTAGRSSGAAAGDGGGF